MLTMVSVCMSGGGKERERSGVGRRVIRTGLQALVFFVILGRLFVDLMTLTDT
jgi:hypothetical protein